MTSDLNMDIHNLFARLKRQKYLKVGLITAIVVVLCFSLAFLLGNFWVDKNSSKGSYKGKTEEQIIADLNAQVAEGEMNVSIANTIKFPEGTLNDGEAKIENIEANHVDQTVELSLVGSDDVLYKSGAIEPGHYIQNIRLNKELEPGQYKARVIFTGYKRNEEEDFSSLIEKITNTHTKVGVLAAEINLLVE